ncbi:predicted protein [Chaetoceros tenuissimus]|uniref:Uncharacterized protein n=1 Tax=Chaetoceros tenuissimus TaxID=426638 RepID=A0AAD3H3N9_9STRA|nr:predicted protein [Chaetoceros tenuissimus]
MVGKRKRDSKEIDENDRKNRKKRDNADEKNNASSKKKTATDNGMKKSPRRRISREGKNTENRNNILPIRIENEIQSQKSATDDLSVPQYPMSNVQKHTKVTSLDSDMNDNRSNKGNPSAHVEIESDERDFKGELKSPCYVYYCFRTIIFSILILASLSVYQVHVDNTYVQSQIHSDLEEALFINREMGENYQMSQKSNEKLRAEIQKLKDEKVSLQSRLDSMINAEDDVQSALENAWDIIDSLKRKNADLEDLQLSFKKARDEEENEKNKCNNRLVDLELETIDYESKLKHLQEEHEELENKYMIQQDTVSLLQHQLEEENGSMWYYELQLKHLENMHDELLGDIEDLKYEKKECTAKISNLKRTLMEEREGALAAVNAVAASANIRRKEESAKIEASSQLEIENAQRQAAIAINDIVSRMSSSDRIK